MAELAHRPGAATLPCSPQPADATCGCCVVLHGSCAACHHAHRQFTDTALGLSLTVLNSLIDLVSFSGILYSIYPPLFAALLAYSIGGTVGSVWLGKVCVLGCVCGCVCLGRGGEEVRGLGDAGGGRFGEWSHARLLAACLSASSSACGAANAMLTA